MDFLTQLRDFVGQLRPYQLALAGLAAVVLVGGGVVALTTLSGPDTAISATESEAAGSDGNTKTTEATEDSDGDKATTGSRAEVEDKGKVPKPVETDGTPETKPATETPPADTPAPTPAPKPAPAAPGEPTPEQWAKLRECEASGRYNAVNPAGPYYGAYQFNQATWNSIASSVGRNDLVGVKPSEASPADQDAMALALYRSRGAQPWPSCGRFLR